MYAALYVLQGSGLRLAFLNAIHVTQIPVRNVQIQLIITIIVGATGIVHATWGTKVRRRARRHAPPAWPVNTNTQQPRMERQKYRA
jgi:hypothetical protein